MSNQYAMLALRVAAVALILPAHHSSLAGGGNIGPVRLPSAQEVGKTVEEGVSNAGKAAADVVTLGEEGRRRDQAAAEAAEREAKQARDAAEAIRQQKISDLQTSVRTLQSVLDSYKQNEDLVSRLNELYDKFLYAANTELADREKSMALFERILDSRRSENNDLKDLVTALSHLQIIDEKLYKAAVSAGQPIVDSDKKAREDAVAAARRILDTAATEGETSNRYLLTAAEQLKTSSLHDMIAITIQAKTFVKIISAQMAAQQGQYAAELDGQKKQLVALGATA